MDKPDFYCRERILGENPPSFHFQKQNQTPERVVAVIVSYRPVLVDLLRLLKAVSPQVSLVVVVDNGATPNLRARLDKVAEKRVHFLPLRENRGVAAAQNIGIAWARDREATHVLLLDQDSEPAGNMVDKLLQAARELAAHGFAVAGIGPRYLDERQSNPPPFIRFNGLRLKRCGCQRARGIAPADYLISSGCLIPMATLDAVGSMREELFIDYVDIEWGLRARLHGYQCFGALAARMRHNLGENPVEIFGRKLPLHNSLRHYYHFRNAIYLYRQHWLPLHWKLADGYRLLLKYGFYTLFAKPRLQHWRMMTTGIWHGMHGRMGKWDGA